MTLQGWEAVALVGLGIFVGTYGTLVGLGGGFLLVPAFLLLGFDPKTAAGTSLAVVCANGFSGTLSYLRQRRVDVPTAVLFAVAGIPGAWLGALIDQWIPERLFFGVFGALLAWAGIKLLAPQGQSAGDLEAGRRRAEEPRPNVGPEHRPGYIDRDFVDAMGERHIYRYHAASGTAVAVTAGFIASALGIGGGLVQVPAMVYAFGFPTHIAIATSQMTIAVTALVGTVSHARFGDVRWPIAILVGLGAIVGAQIGSRIAKRVSAAPLMRLLAIAVILTAAKLLWSAVFG